MRSQLPFCRMRDNVLGTVEGQRLELEKRMADAEASLARMVEVSFQHGNLAWEV